MGWWEDFVNQVAQIGVAFYSTSTVFGDIIGGDIPGVGNGNGDPAAAKANARMFLFGEALLLGGMAALPLLLTYGSKGKKTKALMPLATDASRNAMALITAVAPAVALPAAYITVEKMEGAGLISGPLGDRVQLLMGTMAAGGLVKSVVSVVT